MKNQPGTMKNHDTNLVPWKTNQEGINKNVTNRQTHRTSLLYIDNQHSNSLHCPLHWWSFRDQVNICWNHTKPNCNARSRTDSINHTSNLHVDRCLNVPENGYWNQIFHSIHSVHWMEKLVKPCRPCQTLSSLSKHRGWVWEKTDTFLNRAPCSYDINGVFHQYNFIYDGQTISPMNIKYATTVFSFITYSLYVINVINEKMIWLHISNMILVTQTCGKICLDKTFEGGMGGIIRC